MLESQIMIYSELIQVTHAVDTTCCNYMIFLFITVQVSRATLLYCIIYNLYAISSFQSILGGNW
jgi:hypothetical protein